MTRSSNVAFLELDWTPAKHDQAEDRCHRIGQQDAVNASYLLAAGTIDETIATLLERKRAVIGAVTDGRAEDEEGVVDALVRELRGPPYRHCASRRSATAWRSCARVLAAQKRRQHDVHDVVAELAQLARVAAQDVVVQQLEDAAPIASPPSARAGARGSPRRSRLSNWV